MRLFDLFYSCATTEILFLTLLLKDYYYYYLEFLRITIRLFDMFELI